MSSTGRTNFVNGLELGNGLTGFKTLFQASATIAADQTVRWLTSLPSATEMLTITASGQIGTAPIGSGASNQAQKTFYGGPLSGADAAPTFRLLAYTDLSDLVGATANTIAAGNDSRFHTQNTDTGTTATSFQLDSGNGGPRLKNVSGALHVRNAADNAGADLVVQNLTVSGTTTTVNSETVDIADNLLTLNSNVTSGTPTEDLGLRGLRGASTAASLKWVEAATEWRAGIEGAEVAIARRKTITFTNADLTSGIVVLPHGLGVRLPGFTLYDNNEEIAYPNTAKPNTAGVPTNEYRLDFSGWGTLSGTWTAVFTG